MHANLESQIVVVENDDASARHSTTGRASGAANQFNVREEHHARVDVSTQPAKRSSGNATGSLSSPVENPEGQVVSGHGNHRRRDLKAVAHHVVFENDAPHRSTQKAACKKPGVRRFTESKGRYSAVEGIGRRLWIRDQVTLQADVLSLLRSEGHLPKKRIITDLGAALAAINTALTALLDTKLVEHYKARSRRGRMDEFWCIRGQSPAQPTAFKFPAAATLAAMQSHATQLYGATK